MSKKIINIATPIDKKIDVFWKSPKANPTSSNAANIARHKKCFNKINRILIVMGDSISDQ
jgi:hypothetical protein